MVFYTYMLVCSDGSYYTGHTDNLERRVGEHQSGMLKGHTKSRRPVRLVWSQEFVERHEALAAERQIKGWSRAKKEALIDRRWDELSRLARSYSALRQAQGERIVVAQSALQSIQAHTAATHPVEACGLLLGTDACITQARATCNVHSEPQTHFEIDPQALIDAYREERQGGRNIIGYYHSHPSGDPRPSDTDRATSARDGKVWAILAGEEIRFWRDDPDGFVPLSYSLSDG